MHGADLTHGVALILASFVVIRGTQALVEHYFPNSDPVAVLRFLVGGPG